MNNSKYLNIAVSQISRLPGIGKKTALRLAIHLIKEDHDNVKFFAKSLLDLKSKVFRCKNCNNISDKELCYICIDNSRNCKELCVVEDFFDVIAIEDTGEFNGLYYVLGGKISPIDGIGPDDIYVNGLVDRIKEGKIKEVILALSSTVEGETTSFYIYRHVKDIDVSVSVISRGISVGDEIEYIDQLTLASSIINRVEYRKTIRN